MEDLYKQAYTTLLQEHTAVFERQDMAQLHAVLEAIADCTGNIFILGAGREGIAARSFAMRLMHLGKSVHWLWDDTTPGMHAGDLYIAINGSGCIGHMDYIHQQAKTTGARVVVVTGDPLRSAKDADLTLFIPAAVYKGTCPSVVPSSQPMGNLFEQHLFLLFDVMVMMLETKMQLTHAEMESRHRNIE